MKRGTILRRYRRALDYTQEYIAKAINVSQKLVSRIESGQAIPRSDVLERWCKVMGISVGEFERLCEAEGAVWSEEEED